MNTPFHLNNAQIGEVTLLPLSPDVHIPYVHKWVSQDYAEFWGMKSYEEQQVTDFYQELQQGDKADAFMGFVNDIPCFLVETYDPQKDPVGEHYQYKSGDKGMHILIAPTNAPISGFTFGVFTAVMHFMFSDSDVKRVVVEPDSRNHKIHALNKRAGFQHIRQIQMGEKSANLAFCTQHQFYSAINLSSEKHQKEIMKMDIHQNPALATKSVDAKTWEKVNRHHLRKCLAELSHERVLQPKSSSISGQWTNYSLSADVEGVEYHFKARKLALEHWLIEPGSIKKTIHGQNAALDSISFIIEFSGTLNIPTKLLPTYLEEITSTLNSAAFKENKQWLSAKELLEAGFQQVEAAMSEGHPAFIANNGRIGFDAQDFLQYAPEAGQPVSLIWLAAHKSRADFDSSHDVSYQALIEQELDLTTREAFEKVIEGQGKDAQDYTLIPVHPWQWFNKLANVFAPDIASNHLICLGYGDDSYQAQQSIRTFFNRSNPNKYYVKTALSVLNMGFMRGLSAYYMRTTPAINDWIADLVQNDRYLQNKGFCVLRELAATGYRNPYYEHENLQDNPYKKMLAALWRESPLPLINSGQRLMTMASLLHTDSAGEALLPTLIQASGLSVQAWLTKYLEAYLSPLLHCYYQHSLVFMPHGENLILVFENHVPVKAIMKDIGEEVALLNTDIELPEKVKRISVKIPEDKETLSIFTDVFDCFFRYMSAILVEHFDFSEQEFWKLVANCVQQYQDDNPHLQSKFKKHNLFAKEFDHSCLNRLQLANNQQMVDLANPASSLQFAGSLVNPIAQFTQQAENSNSTILERSVEV